MINIKRYIGDAISEVVENVSDVYPAMTESFPCVQISEEDNRQWDETKTIDYLRFRIDVWGTASVSDLACQIDAEIQKLGFVRIAASDIAEPRGLRQKLMRYEGLVDINTEQVFTQNLH